MKKLQLLIFEPTGKSFDETINLAGSELKRQKVAKFLGISLDDKFTWNVHFANILLKLKRNLHMIGTGQNIMSIHAKKFIYFGHLQSHLIYCLNVWGNLMSACNLKQLQKLQNKSLRLIFGNTNHTKNRSHHGILNISELVMLENYKFGFKYVNKLLPTRLIKELETDSKNKTLVKKHRYNTRNKHLPNAPTRMTPLYRRSLLYKAINNYNKLPTSIKNSRTLKSFITKCKNHLLNING